jgi:uncharacterized protein (TIRG00374 family)
MNKKVEKKKKYIISKAITKKNNKNNNNKYIGSLTFMVLLMAITSYYIFKDQSFASLVGVIQKINPVYILIGFSMMFLYLACEAVGINIIMKSLGQKVSLFKGLGYSFVGFYFSAITPSASGGQPAQVYYMNKDKINISYSSLTLLILSVFHQLVALLYAGIMFLVRHSFVKEDIGAMKILIIYGVVSNVILIGGMIGIVFSKKFVNTSIKFLVKILAKVKIVKNIDKTMDAVDKQILEYQKGAEHIKENPALMFKVCVITIVQVTSMFLVPYFVYKAFNLTGYGVLDIIAVQAILTLAVSSLPLPGAVGASETGFLNMFKVFFAGSMLIPAMLVSRILNFYAFVALSALITLVIHVKQVKRESSKKKVYRLVSMRRFDFKKYMINKKEIRI